MNYRAKFLLIEWSFSDNFYGPDLKSDLNIFFILNGIIHNAKK